MECKFVPPKFYFCGRCGKTLCPYGNLANFVWADILLPAAIAAGIDMFLFFNDMDEDFDAMKQGDLDGGWGRGDFVRLGQRKAKRIFKAAKYAAKEILNFA